MKFAKYLIILKRKFPCRSLEVIVLHTGECPSTFDCFYLLSCT